MNNYSSSSSSSCIGFIESGVLCYQATQIFTYRTKDGKAFFKFRYINLGNHWEIDIEGQPNYRGRDTTLEIIHREMSSRSRIGWKICFHKGKEPRTLNAAKKISKAWAECTWKYILTGITIDIQIERANA